MNVEISGRKYSQEMACESILTLKYLRNLNLQLVCTSSVILLLLLLSRFSRFWLCDPIDGSPPGSPVPGILQARTPEWVVISFSNAWKWKVKVKSLSCVRLLATPWTAAYQAPPSVGFSRQEYWSGVPLPSPVAESEEELKSFFFFFFNFLILLFNYLLGSELGLGIQGFSKFLHSKFQGYLRSPLVSMVATIYVSLLTNWNVASLNWDVLWV